MPHPNADNNEKGRGPIAIVGIGCRFPGGANGPEQFWQLLRDGVDAISEVPPDRWSLRKFYHVDPKVPGKVYARWGGFIEGIDRFDASFFGITPREASRMDPQQRLLLEVSYEAIEDAGLSLDRLAGSRTGVFTGISTYDYGALQGQSSELRLTDGYTNLGGALSIAAARISYAFDLKGPCLAVDTACSSSLVSTHLGCQSIWNQESELAMIGGVNIILSHAQTEGFCKSSMLAPDGRCKSFDSTADGYARAEGAGVIVLKPLDQALKDDDQIYAVIKATAVNQDGHSSSIAVPDRLAQETMLREAYKRAGIDTSQVQYVEAHGTGTPVGDPIEACAIGNVLGADRNGNNPCILGSAKSNIGHLEAGAGVAGVIKAALSLKHGEIPATLHYRQPNPDIPFQKLKLRVSDKLQPWPDVGETARVAGVNSFGFGGTNAHVVLQEAPKNIEGKVNKPPDPNAALLLLSARSRDALIDLATSYQESLVSGPLANVSLFDVCRTAFHRRTHHDFRLGAAAHSTHELADFLGAFVAGEKRLTLSSGRRPGNVEPKVAFVFSGMGPQWWAMGRELFEQEPTFRRTFEQCDSLLSQHADWSLIEALWTSEESSRIHETQIAQPAIFALQAGLAALWDSWGIKADAIVGHSVGEVAAAHIAGVLSLEDAVQVIYHRSRLQHTTEGRGKMLAVGLSPDDARDLLKGREDLVSLAAINSPKSTTLTGDPAVLLEVSRTLDRDGVFARFLNVEVPYHSPSMDTIHDELLDSLHDIQPKATLIPLISTALGKMVQGPELDANYWWLNVRHPVLFADAMAQIVECGCNTLLEISAHPVLAPSMMECLGPSSDAAVIHSLRRQEPECATMLGNLGRLYVKGYQADWSRAYSKPKASSRVKLPRYPWQHEHYWSESTESKHSRIGLEWHPLLGEPMAAARRSWGITIDARTPPYLSDHRIQGAVVYPAAAFVEMGLAAARIGLGEGPIVLEDFEILKALILKDNEATELQLTLDDDTTSFDIRSRSCDVGSSWALNMKGSMRLNTHEPEPNRIDVQSLRERCPTEISASDFYDLLEGGGLEYGPEFRTVENIRMGKDEGFLEIRGAAPGSDSVDCLLPPPVLDACFQAPAMAMFQTPVMTRKLYLPVSFQKLTFYSSPGPRIWCHARQNRKTEDSIEFDLRLFDEAGNIVAEIIGGKWQSVGQQRAGFPVATEDHLSRYQWRKANDKENCVSSTHKLFLRSTPNLTDIVRSKLETLSRELARHEHYEQVSPELNLLTMAFVLNTIRQLGFNLDRGQHTTESSMMETMGISRICRPLMLRLIEFLQIEGVLSKSDGEWQFLSAPDFPSPEKLWLDLLWKRPSYVAELTLIQRYGAGLANLLRDHVDELDLIFPDDITTTVDHLFQDAPTGRIYSQLLHETIAAAFEDVPSERVVRILEIGPGCGRTGACVHSRLFGIKSHHVIAFGSEEAEGRRPFYGQDSCVEFVTFDQIEDLLDQELVNSRFDVVLLPDGLNVGQSPQAVLSVIRRLLAPGGLFILLEATALPSWMNLTLAPLWNAGASDSPEANDPESTPKWNPAELLIDAGFSDVGSVAESVPKSNMTLFLCRNSQSELVESPTKTEDAPAEVQEEPGTWLVFSDGSELCQSVAGELQNRNHHTVMVEPGSDFERQAESRFRIRPKESEDMRRLVDTIMSTTPPCRGIIHFWSLTAPRNDSMTADGLVKAQNAGCLSVVHLVQALQESSLKDLERLHIVTRGSQSVGETMARSLAATPVWGLARVLVNEQPAFQTRLIDLDPEPDSNEVDLLLGELWNRDGEDEVAFRTGIRYVHRLETISRTEFTASETQTNSEAIDSIYGVELKVGTAGILDSLQFRPALRKKLGPSQVEIEVEAAGLNFKDVAKALGLLTADSLEGTASGRTLGLECSGKITAVGNDVTDFQVGDEVFGFARNALGSHAIAEVGLIARLPTDLTHEEAATLTTVAMTAHYALNYLGRISKGERVLIHAAAGGVGLAAIQLAQSAGAEVIATAGNSEKREILRALGVVHVLDSRSVAFADEIMKLTDGRGVDVVLNSLSGEMLAKSFGVLASFGRFVEIGKRDIEQNNKLGLRPFQNNLSFFAADLDRLCAEKPKTAEAVCGEVMDRIRNKTLVPLPHRVFSASRIIDAFRYMTKAKHIGKIVIAMKGAGDMAPTPEHQLELRSDATYLVTGGLSGFGLATARWLTERGARHLALVGRSGASTEEARNTIASMADSGVKVVVANVDVTDENAVSALLGDIGNSMPPLRGIVHCAMVLDDSMVNNLNAERLHRVLAPKIVGAWNLHTMTCQTDLDFFVMYSSFASIVGNPGQGNYAAANAFLDELCHYRRSLGLPALTVNWGAIGDVGVIARNADLQEHFKRLGITPLSSERGLSILGQLIRRDLVQSVVSPPADLSRWIHFLSTGTAARFSQIAKGTHSGDSIGDGNGDNIRNIILDAGEDQRYGLLENHLRHTLASVLGASPDKIDVEQPLIEMGIDSLMTIEIATLIQTDLGVEVPPIKFMEGISLAGLSVYIVDEVLGCKQQVENVTS